jgi:L-aminopeptidase/D-esterase-like protein
VSVAGAEPKPRARDLGIPFEGLPGRLNAITDVSGVTVGHTTLIAGSGALRVGEGPVRTGVTAILPRGTASLGDPVFGGWFSLNGNGEMTGTTWLQESGFLFGPVMITNTHSVGVVRDAVIAWFVKQRPGDETADWWSLPVVAETWDGFLNDINGFHVKAEHAFNALEAASSGPVAEGNVGGGTGMVCYGFKGGIGTASRVVSAGPGAYTVGVLVQTNFGARRQLRIAGVPVGREITEAVPYASLAPRREPGEVGSIIIVVATDAPLLPHQLERLARRAGLGVARTGGVAMNDSGDIFLAFSTANRGAAATSGLSHVTALSNEELDPLFEATVQASEEAIVNALVAAESMTGADGHSVIAMPHERVRQLLRQHGVLKEDSARK